MKSTPANKLLRNVARRMRVARRRTFGRTADRVVPAVLGAIGLVVMSGLAAIMMLSPRTRYRALGAAKSAYGRVSRRLGSAPGGEQLGAGHEPELRESRERGGEASSRYATI